MNAEKIATLDAIARDEFEEYLRTHDMTGLTDVKFTGFMIDPLMTESAFAIVFAHKPPHEDVFFHTLYCSDLDAEPGIYMDIEDYTKLRIQGALDFLAGFGTCACANKRYCASHAYLRNKR